MFSIGLNSFKSVKAGQKIERITKKYSKSAYDTWKNVIKNFNRDFKLFLEENDEKLAEYENSLVFMEMHAFTKRLA
ncbi:MAG: hypothetical protein GPJ52_09625, partial [Candidatus Heimdallarchaeota archaeon]|nr:hypothetical protein [Candidatus Heimdallarchaeota archaeon]